MPLKSKCAALIVAFLLCAAVSPAYALSMMDPFNMSRTLDEGVNKIGENIPYANGDRQKLDIYAPAEIPRELAPVVIFYYGGAWKQGTKEDYVFVGHALAAKGFVVVIPDYRLVPEVQYPDFVFDNAAAVKWVEDNIRGYGGDKRRVFLSGHSAGAYNAVMLGMDSSYLRQFSVTIPIRGVAALSGPYAVYPFEFKELEAAFGNVDNPQLTQPINLPTEETVPMFLGHGDLDFIVSKDNTLLMQKKLLQANRSVTAKIYESLEHMEPVMALSTVWRWRSPVLEDMVEFFKEQGAFDKEAFDALDLVGPADGTKETAVDAANEVVTSLPPIEALPQSEQPQPPTDESGSDQPYAFE